MELFSFIFFIHRMIHSFEHFNYKTISLFTTSFVELTTKFSWNFVEKFGNIFTVYCYVVLENIRHDRAYVCLLHLSTMYRESKRKKKHTSAMLFPLSAGCWDRCMCTYVYACVRYCVSVWLANYSVDVCIASVYVALYWKQSDRPAPEIK